MADQMYPFLVSKTGNNGLYTKKLKMIQMKSVKQNLIIKKIILRNYT